MFKTKSAIFSWVMAIALSTVFTASQQVTPVYAAVINVSGNITTNTTWTAGNVYYVIGDVTVLYGVTLTIDPGAIVKFQNNRRLIIAGKLTAIGTAGQRVYFTSYRDDLIGGDTNGDGPTTGGAGDWGWIEFSLTSDPASVIEYAVIQYGGYVYYNNYRGNIYVLNASPTIRNSTINYSANAGVYGEATLGAGSASPTITSTTFSNNNGAALDIDVATFPTLTGNTATSNGTNGVGVRGGTIAANTQWNQTNLVYRIVGSITIADGATLTIAPGMALKINNNVQLIVGGKLTVAGTSGQRVYFTSYRDDTVRGDTNGDGPTTGGAGDWGWIQFTATSDPTSAIEYAIIQYGGYVYYNIYRGNIYALDASPAIRNSTISYSANAGVYSEATLGAGSASPTITSTTFSNNNGAALDIDVATFPTLAGNTVTGNGTNGVGVRGGTVVADTQWNQTNLVYRLVGSITIANGATLTISPGMALKLNNNVQLIVGGKLTVAGTSGQRVYFTSYRDDTVRGDTNGDGPTTGGAGDWGWIQFTATSDPTSAIEYAIIQYGGYVYYNVYRGNIYVLNASPTILNSIISYSANAGVYGEATLGAGSASPTITNTTFSNNSGAALDIDVATFLALTGNTVTSNGTNGVGVRGGTIAANTQWNQTDLVYRVAGHVTIANGSTLTIAPGMTLKFNNNVQLIVGGKLTVAGTSGQRVYFTSYRDDTVRGDTNGDGPTTGGAGDWGWIEFAASSDPTSVIEYGIIQYGGYVYYNNYRGNILLTSASPILRRTILSNSAQDGVYASGNSQPTLECNEIKSNNALGIRNTTPATSINAANQYWGAASGPYHPTSNPTGTGNGVSDGVNFTPWLATPCTPQVDTYTISGRVTDSGGNGIAGVTVSTGSNSTITNANGNYTVSGVLAGSYTLTPSKSGYTFSPPTRNISVPPSSSSQDFSGTLVLQLGKIPIVFVHGWTGFPPWGDCNWPNPDTYFQSVDNQLYAEGYYTGYAALETSPCFTPHLTENVWRLQNAIALAKAATGQSKVILVAHSMGGLVSRAYIEDPSKYAGDVSALFTFGSPHLGVPSDPLTFFANGVSLGTYCNNYQPAVCDFSVLGMALFNRDHKQNTSVTYHVISGDAPFFSRNAQGMFMDALIPGADDGIVPLLSGVGLAGTLDRGQTDEVHGTIFGSRAYFVRDGGQSVSYTGCLKKLLVDNRHNPNVTCGGVSTLSVATQSAPTLGDHTPIEYGSLLPGQIATRTISLEGGTILFASQWQTGTFSVTLRSPSDLLIDPAYATANPSVVSYTTDGNATTYYFPNTEGGDWKLILEAVSVPISGAAYSTFAAFDSSVALAGGVDKLWYAPSTTATLTATLSGSPASAVLTATVLRADGITATVPLSPLGGGKYQGTYNVPNAPGYAEVRLTATGTLTGGLAFERGTTLLFQISPNSATLNSIYSEAVQPYPLFPSLYQALTVTVGVNSNISGTLGLSADLIDGNRNFVAHSLTIQNVMTGTTTLSLRYDGADIFASQRNGPYTLTNVLLTDQTGAMLVLAEMQDVYTTATAYQYQSFASPQSLYLPLIRR